MAGANDNGSHVGGAARDEPDERQMHITDAIHLNILFAGLHQPRPGDDDDWFTAAITLLGRAETALQGGFASSDIAGWYRPHALQTIARVVNGDVICGCGHVRIDDYRECEACRRELVIPEAGPGCVDDSGRLRCPECGGDQHRLYTGTRNRRGGRQVAMVVNEGWHLVFEAGSGEPCEPPRRLDGSAWEEPCVQCANEQCLRIVEVPETVHVTIGAWTARQTAAPPDLPALPEDSAAASGLHIVHARVNGNTVAFLVILPSHAWARALVRTTFERMAEPRSVQVRPAAVPVGERVRTLWPIDRYPHFVVPAGSAGEVTTCERGLCAVRFDEPVPGMEPWHNELCFTAEAAAAEGLSPPTAATAMWASCEPEPLS